MENKKINPLVPVNPQGLDDIAEALLQGSPVPDQSQSTNLNFQTNSNFWRVEGVPYKNGLYRVDVLKQLLDNGQSHTQDQWVQFSKNARTQGNFYVGDMPLYHALFTALYEQKDGAKKQEIEQTRDFIQKQMRKKWLMTLTRVAYQPSRKDKVIHNYGANEQYELNESITGPDRFIETGDKNTLKALLGTDNINEINSVYQFINNTRAYLYRANSKPDNLSERVVGFYANSDGASLYCGGDPTGTDSSLGVRAQKI